MLSSRLLYRIANTFGWFYILTSASTLAGVVHCLQPLRRYSLRVRGAEFPTVSWVGMLFAAGIGSGMLYWSAIEWAYYVQAPPFGAELSPVKPMTGRPPMGSITGAL